MAISKVPEHKIFTPELMGTVSIFIEWVVLGERSLVAKPRGASQN